MKITRSILKHSINAWDRFCEWLASPAQIDEAEIARLWNFTSESQFDCDWDELSDVGRDQVIRFANTIIEQHGRG